MDFKSLREFKSGLTTAFDTAQIGEKVVITRRGVRYLLVSEDAVKEARREGLEKIEKKNLSSEVHPELEKPCCSRQNPCKHWIWDIQTGEGYKNTLSGRLLASEA